MQKKNEVTQCIHDDETLDDSSVHVNSIIFTVELAFKYLDILQLNEKKRDIHTKLTS